MSQPSKESLHKEFELERLILFSDAVFAIAITLLIIEIKFPHLPENLAGVNIVHEFKPLIFEFVAFLISFFFIGLSWSKHLKLCKHLKTYDDGVIFRNLFSLLFIVTFPFAASSLTHIQPGFMLPMVIYIGNIFLVCLSHFMLTDYTLHKKQHLIHAGNDAEKKYLYVQAKFPTILMGATFLTALVSSFFVHGMNDVVAVSYAVPLGIGSAIMKRKIKKYKVAYKNSTS